MTEPYRKARARFFLPPRALLAKGGKQEVGAMASKPRKADLLAKLEEMGVEAPKGARVDELIALVEEAEGGWPRTMRVECPGYRAVNVRKAPSAKAPVTGTVGAGAQVLVYSEKGGWAKVDGGYCMAEFLA